MTNLVTLLEKNNVSLNIDSTLFEVIELILDSDIGLLVFLDNNIPVGVISQKEILKFVHEEIPNHFKIKDIFTPQSPYTINLDENIQDTLKTFIANSIKHAVVVDHEKKFHGILTIDILLQYTQNNHLPNKTDFTIDLTKTTLEYLHEDSFIASKVDDTFIITWMNTSATKLLGNCIDMQMTKLISSQSWDLITSKLNYSDTIINHKVKIKDYFFEINCTKHIENNTDYLLFTLKNITEYFSKVELIQKQEDKLHKKISILQKIIDQQPQMIFVSDGFDISLNNKSFLEFFYVKSIDEFFQNNQKLQTYFIQNGDNFTLNDPNENWIEEIQQIKENKKIISLINPQTFEPVTFKVIITALDRAEHKTNYLVFLENISNASEGQNENYYNSTHDTMTRSYNKAFLIDNLEKYIYKSKRYNLHFSLIRFNIDEMQKINDLYGFSEGDKIIKSITNNVLYDIRACDLLARYDSDDFIILLPQTTAMESDLICKNIQKSLRDIKTDTGSIVTLCFGITEYHIADNQQTIMTRTKNALLQAKENGSNSIVRL